MRPRHTGRDTSTNETCSIVRHKVSTVRWRRRWVRHQQHHLQPWLANPDGRTSPCARGSTSQPPSTRPEPLLPVLVSGLDFGRQSSAVPAPGRSRWQSLRSDSRRCDDWHLDGRRSSSFCWYVSEWLPVPASIRSLSIFWCGRSFCDSDPWLVPRSTCASKDLTPGHDPDTPSFGTTRSSITPATHPARVA